MDKSAVERLENNHYAMDKAHERLKKAIDNNHEQEIYAATGELLLWVNTTDEWHRKWNKGYRGRKSRSQNGKVIFGLLHAYNSIKHNMNFIKIHRPNGGLTFPMTFPVEIEKITFSWIDSKGVLEEGREGTIKNYKRYIEGEELIPTLAPAIAFLKQEFDRVKRN